MNEQARMERRKYEPSEPAATCIDGSVTGTGPLGAGLARVDVTIEGEAVGEGPQIFKVAQTDGRGEFHVCLSREQQSLVAQALVDAPPFRDRTYRLHIHFRREGYEAKALERTIATGTAPARIDVHLDRASPAS